MPDRADLQADHNEIASFQELLAELRLANPGWAKWRKARVAAGVTLRRAAEELEITPSELSDIERGQTKPSDQLAERMKKCYDG